MIRKILVKIIRNHVEKRLCESFDSTEINFINFLSVFLAKEEEYIFLFLRSTASDSSLIFREEERVRTDHCFRTENDL